MGPTSATTEWPESAWHLLVRPEVTWREALQGSAFLATSLLGAGLVVVARSVRRSRRRAS